MNCRRACAPLIACLALLVTACASPGAGDAQRLTFQLQRLLPADVVLLAEQHDAPDHQRLQREAVVALAARGQLAALALEMAAQGTSTRGLGTGDAEALVRERLRWNDAAWPWTAYGPVVMAAVRAGVPVFGANLPREQMADAMKNIALDQVLTGAAVQKHRENIEQGHCGLLPASQIAPMARIQIARDIAMARTVEQVALPGKTVLLVAGGMHVLRDLGVPQHLRPGLEARVLLLRAGDSGPPAQADAILSTPARPAVDYCAGLRERLPPARASTPG